MEMRPWLPLRLGGVSIGARCRWLNAAAVVDLLCPGLNILRDDERRLVVGVPQQEFVAAMETVGSAARCWVLDAVWKKNGFNIASSVVLSWCSTSLATASSSSRVGSRGGDGGDGGRSAYVGSATATWDVKRDRKWYHGVRGGWI
ncbi:hypothetical protein E2562_027682 [Oryza meyeriana var. granulata]|uniref:Uncharacterized protein n=1 Tax=Oryza meyeriana var. granulata TaxID=110450 RepID=A0A6G1CTG0_9ORYZ|nr:hypothetical protein E2562_027682 [Oryza meyeriana var. granulata]